DRPRHPDAWRLPPRTGSVERQRLGGARLRGRACALARGASPEAVAAPRRRRNAPLVRLRRVDRRRRTRGLGGAGAGGVPRRLLRLRRSEHRAAARRGARSVARGVRAGEGGVRAPLRAQPQAGLDRDSGGGDRPPPRVLIDLANPHALLGAHPQNGGVVVRVLRPEAASVRVVPYGVDLEHVEGGVWEGVVRGAEVPLDYALEVSYSDGETFTVRDPYAFVP